MFDLVAKYRRWIMLGLFLLIIPPFALFGIDSYWPFLLPTIAVVALKKITGSAGTAAPVSFA